MPNRSEKPYSGVLMTDSPELTLNDLCDTCRVSIEQVDTYISEGVLEPSGKRREKWRFSHQSVVILRKARKLENELGLNTAGVALALDLLGRIETLQQRLARYERDI